MKRLIVIFLLVGIACTTTKSTGTNTKDVIKNDVMDTTPETKTTDVTKNDDMDTILDANTKDVTKNDGINDGMDTTLDTKTTDMFQPPNCTLSPDDQKGLTFTCDTICQKIAKCNQDENNDVNQSECLFRCKAFRIEAKVDMINSFGQCIMNFDCSNGDPVDGCQHAVMDYVNAHSSDVTTAQKTDCQTLVSKLQTCGEVDEADVQEVNQDCLSIWAALRPEAGQRIVACKDKACDAIRDCYDQALCVDMWSLPQQGSSESAEPGQDVYVGHDVTPQPDEIRFDVQTPDVPPPPDGMLDLYINPDNEPQPDGMNNDNPGPQDIPQVDVNMPCKEYPAQTGFDNDKIDTVCNKDVQCNSQFNKNDCIGFINSVKNYVSTKMLNNVADCVTSTDCSKVPSDTDIVEFCHQQVASSTQPTEQQKTECHEFAQHALTCGWNKDDVKQECMQTMTEMRPEVINNYLACKDMDCIYLDTCTHAAACLPSQK